MTSAAPAAGNPAPANSGTGYFTQFLTALGITPNAANLAALEDVRHYEGNNTRNNPLNAVQVEPGSTQFNSVGVQSYPDEATGLKGEVALFSGSHWDAVRAALKTGSESSILSAFDAGYTWSPGTKIPTLSASAQATEASTLVGPNPSGSATAISAGGGNASAIDLNPGDIPGEIAGAATSGVAGSIESVINTFLRPFLNFVENAALVFWGLVLLIIGLVVLAHVASNGSTTSAVKSSSPAQSLFGSSKAKTGSTSPAAKSTAPTKAAPAKAAPTKAAPAKKAKSPTAAVKAELPADAGADAAGAAVLA